MRHKSAAFCRLGFEVRTKLCSTCMHFRRMGYINSSSPISPNRNKRNWSTPPKKRTNSHTRGRTQARTQARPHQAGRLLDGAATSKSYVCTFKTIHENNYQAGYGSTLCQIWQQSEIPLRINVKTWGTTLNPQNKWQQHGRWRRFRGYTWHSPLATTAPIA